MFLQYLVTTFALIGIASFTILGSLLPWMREHQKRSYQTYLLAASKARIEGNWDESRRCYMASLACARRLEEPGLEAICRNNLALLNRVEAESKKDMAVFAGRNLKKVWPGPIEFVRGLKVRRKFARWKPFFRGLIQQKSTDARHDAAALIDLGDALVDMAQYDSALAHYEAAIKEAPDDDVLMRASARDRVACVYFAQRKFYEAERDLLQARTLLRQPVGGANSGTKNKTAKTSPLAENLIALHLAQTYLYSNQPGKAEECLGGLDDKLILSDPELFWYRELLLGDCASRLDETDKAIEHTKTARDFAEKKFGRLSKESLRSYDNYWLVLYRLKKFDEAKSAFDAASKLHVIIDESSHTALVNTTYKEALRYFLWRDYEIAAWLWEWNVALKESEGDDVSPAIARRLYWLTKCYRGLGEREKADNAIKRAKSISVIDPTDDECRKLESESL